MLQTYILPLAPFLLIALNAILCLFVFLCLENEIRILKRGATRGGRIPDASIADLKTGLEELTLRIQDTEARLGMTTLPLSPKASLNLNRRTQAIRLSRRGEPAETIAASLCMPRKEVELLLKVQRLVLNGSPEPT